MKDSLVKIEDRGTGRVLLSDFYKPGLDGQWQFQESASYLRQLGALDESSKTSVVIVNYLTSPGNCIASSSFYSVCCMDECEGLLGHLEHNDPLGWLLERDRHGAGQQEAHLTAKPSRLNHC